LVGKATTDTLTNKTLTTPSVSSPTISDGTANGVAYLNGSKVLTTGSSLTWDGTNLTVNTGTVSATYGKLTVAGGISITPDSSSKFQIGRFSAGAPYSYIKMGSTSSGLKFTDPTDSFDLMTLDASGNLLVGKTALDTGVAGCEIRASGIGVFTSSGGNPLLVNRLTNDGDLVVFRQDGVTEGTISVSGTTVSYNGGHLSRWAQTTTAKDESLVKGTVLSNLDEMNVYADAEGNPVDNEQLNKVKVSDTEGDVNFAGVFVNWTHDEDHNVDEINMAMTGDMIIRIAQGVTVARGDLLMSAGDGTAKPQGDDIVRSKTVAKVTSNHVTCTYADGSYCVPCVLMAC
jgi:hypothetical protein